MKRLALFLLVMTMTGAGVSYAETNNPIQNFFLGNQQLSGEGFNQVLSLLIGPEGQPGPAGVSGRDGAAGLNGSDGAPGPQGPQGEAGPPGLAGADGRPVVSVQLAAGSLNCPNGGVQLTDGTGLVTYVCNGARGEIGVRGPSGPQGPTGATGASGGTVSSGTSSSGSGQLTLGTCDDEITVSFPSIFIASGFILEQVQFSGVSSRCNNQFVSISFPIQTSVPTVGSNPTPPYQFGTGANRDFVDCSTGRVTLANGEDNVLNLSTQDRQFGNYVALTCQVRSSSAAIDFDSLFMADIAPNIGIQIGS